MTHPLIPLTADGKRIWTPINEAKLPKEIIKANAELKAHNAKGAEMKARIDATLVTMLAAKGHIPAGLGADIANRFGLAFSLCEPKVSTGKRASVVL